MNTAGGWIRRVWQSQGDVLFFAVLACVAAACAYAMLRTPHNPTALSTLIGSGELPQTAAVGVEPSIERSSLGSPMPGTFRLVLVNPLDVPVTYTGYTLESTTTPPPPGEISPLYQTEIRPALDGAWQPDDRPGWCGTGSDQMVVPPHSAGRFAIERWNLPSQFRVGISCGWQTKDGRDHQKVIWSEGLPAVP